MGERFNKLRFCIFIILFILFIPPLVEAKTADEWLYEGNDLVHAEKYAEAIKAFDEALKINPVDAEAWKGKGTALSKLGRNDEAIIAYNEAVDAWMAIGITKYIYGEYDEAIKAYDEVLKINPQYAEAWDGKGTVLSELGRNDEAIKAYDEAIKIDPNLTMAWYNKGITLSELGRNDEAIKAYDEVLKINPQYSNAWFNKGVIFYELGEYDKANEAYDKAMAIDEAKFVESNNWIIIGGAVIFLMLGLFALRNKNKSKDNVFKNSNVDSRINKWKIFGYIIITWIVFYFIANRWAGYADGINVPLTVYEVQEMIWSLMSVMLGVLITLLLRRKRELIYGILFSFFVMIPVIGVFFGLVYFTWSYYKLEKKGLLDLILFPVGLIFSLTLITIGELIIILSFFEFAFHWQDFLMYLFIALIASGIVGIIGGSLNKKFNNDVKTILNTKGQVLFENKGLNNVFVLLLIVLLPLLIYFLTFALYSAITFTMYGFLILSYIPRIPLIILIALAIVALGTFYAIIIGLYHLFFPPKRKTPGIEIKKEEQETLWEMINEIAEEIKTKPIDKIVITPNPGIGVYLEGGLLRTVLGFGRRTLEIGLPSLYNLNVDELKAIIAHEYGHFGNRDTQWSSFTFSMGSSLLSALHSTPGPAQDGSENGGIVRIIMFLNPAYWVLLIYIMLFFKITNGFSRIREVMADNIAMKLYGGKVFSNALIKVVLNDLIFSKGIQDEYLSHSHRMRTISNYSQLIESYHRKIGESELEMLKSDILSQTESVSIYDSHPPLKMRLDYAEKFDKAEINDDRPVINLFNYWDNINERLAKIHNQTVIIYNKLNES